MALTKRTSLLLVAGTLLLTAGCTTWPFHRKPKPDPHISVQVEETFKQRWIEQRGADLMKQGLAPDVARSQAIEEFRKRYEYTSAAKE